MDQNADVTQLLLAAQSGQQEAIDRLMPMVYDELRALARQRRRFERPDHTFNTTALVHEAYLKLVDQREATWQNRAHFFAIAATSMRRILLEHARKRRALKRGGADELVRVDNLDEVAVEPLGEGEASDILALDEALSRMTAFNERGSKVVEYRYFVGLTYEEIADVMGLSVMTVRRAWEAARAWLSDELQVNPR